ncbi:NF-kappa-B inhibitor zeta [Bagarius yarrelli]|uniref:NF-kappa-B inhibitor zeta n=1 Tax=Bagarius yarrelli TaxID=175774 RepID=A0A556UZW6_BAGYA|nr:NF-kappa-B inhibitor zeta [Bagarius yarrelli]
MVSSQDLKTGSKRTPLGYKGEEGEYGTRDRSPLSRAPVWNMNRTHSPTSALAALNVEVCSPSENTQQKGKMSQKKRNDRTYLGVRVRMPVKDMLRDIRIAKGMDPKEMQLGNKLWTKNISQQEHLDQPPFTPPKSYAANKKSPMHSVEIYGSEYGQAAFLFTETKNKTGSGEFDYYLPRRQHEMTCSPRDSKMHVSSPQEIYYSTKTDLWGSPHKLGRPSPLYSEQEQWDSMTYFWTQMEREAHLLNGFSNQELLTQDEKGRTLLHRAVDEGNRSFVYVVARQMADLNKLDSKDAEGRTSLHLAAQKNQHLMVADLISLGANINERDRYGKTCLHLGAEYGYVNVLEVLKSYMKNGIYIDLEAQDVNGLSALQLASLSLKSIVGDLEKSMTASQARVHFSRKEQMTETLECLLQMECNLQSLVRQVWLAVGHVSYTVPKHFN